MNSFGIAAGICLVTAAAGIVLGLTVFDPPAVPEPQHAIAAPPTEAAATHLRKFQDALRGEGITADDATATQWGTTACRASSPSTAALEIDQQDMAHNLPVPAGQELLIANAAFAEYCEFH